MSDARLRELERRFKESGAFEDEVAYLLERVRVGLVSQERLNFTAQYGAVVSRELLGLEDVPYVPENLMARVHGLGSEALLVAALAAARSNLWIWERKHSDDQRLIVALDSVEAWLNCPCPKHARLSIRAASRLTSGVSRPFYTILECNVAEVVRMLADSARGCFFLEQYHPNFASSVIHHACRVDRAVRLTEAYPEMAKTIVRSLIPWALGYNATVADPQKPTNGTD